MTGRYKLVFSSNDQPWLIDLHSDPNELTNLFGQMKHRKMVRQMTMKLRAYGRTHNDEHVQHPRIRSWMDDVLKGE